MSTTNRRAAAIGAALACGALVSSSAAHVVTTGPDRSAHEASMTWIVEEACTPGDSYHANDEDWAGGDELRNLPASRPRLAGHFRSQPALTVTVLLRSDGKTDRVR